MVIIMNNDDKKLIPATDEEIEVAINEVLDEMDDEFKAIFEAEDTEEEKEMLAELEKAETVEERTAVMKKYKIGPYRDGAEGLLTID